jgi:Lantibiotic biosynthesis dehydratase C-term
MPKAYPMNQTSTTPEAAASPGPQCAGLFPDPFLTANLYCNRRLDLLAREVLGGFSSDLARMGSPDEHFFWFMRYGKCGEHMKVRVHGPDSIAAEARQSLEAHANRFFATPDAEPDPTTWLSKSAIPAIDIDDEQDEDYENKSLLWSRYRRSPIVFGAEAYLEDAIHLDRFCRCQAAVTSMTLGALFPRLGDPSYHKHRQAVFIELLLAAVSTLALSRAETASYLGYHRDWLIRSLVYNATPAGSITFEDIQQDLQSRANAMSDALRPLTGHIASALDSAREPKEYCRSFHQAFSSFYEHVSGYRGQPRFNQDPFTQDYAYLPVFKVLHFAANQFGFRLSNEAFIYNLLLHATRPLLPQVSQAEE